MRKNLLLLGMSLVLTASAGVVNAQIRSVPLDVTIVTPASGTVIAPGASFSLSLTIANQSATENLVQGDTLLFNISPFMEEGELSGALLPAGIVAGGSLTIQFPTPYPNPNNTGANVTEEICVMLFGTAQSDLGGSWENPNFEDTGCTTITLQSSTVGINEDLTTEWSVYPNPANDQLSITADRLSNDAQIVIYNSVGQRVFEDRIGMFRNAGAIQTSNWENGIYLLTITENGNSRTERVLIQH